MYNAWVKFADAIWYQNHIASIALLPLSLLYRMAVAIRRAFYRLFPPTPFPIPIVVVGNLTVGGTGKTPLVIALAKIFSEQGYRVGIISRGYRASPPYKPYLVKPEDDVATVGDEAKLITQKVACPMVIDPHRKRAAEYLLNQKAINLIISDDGLQHLALSRAIEIVVIDGSRVFGNTRLLPAGPLREPVKRANEVDCAVVNGRSINGLNHISKNKLNKIFTMDMQLTRLCHFATAKYQPMSHFKSQIIHLNTAIGNPQRLEQSLAELSIATYLHPYPDHYRWCIADFIFDDDLPIMITEKDAVKCTFLLDSADSESRAVLAKLWVLESEIKLDIELVPYLTQRISKYRNGRLSA